MEHYRVTGMTCAACSARVEKAVSAVPGVTACSVNLLTGAMGVEGTATGDAVIAAVERAGYGVARRDEPTPAKEAPAAHTDDSFRRLRRRLILSTMLLLPLMYLSMGHTMAHWPLPLALEQNPVAIGLLQLLLTAAVMVVNQQFFISGFRSLFHGAPNMDTLVSMGAGAAFGYSTVMLFLLSAAGDNAAATSRLHGLYFESAAMILTLITVGKLLEAHSKGRTTDAIRGLMALTPPTATLVIDGVETVVPVEQVNAGDVFVVRPGETVPVDGVIEEGDSALNEAALTGESVPADKRPGDSVFAGTLNQSGYLRCRAARVGEDTTLAQIIRLVEDAAATKAPIARLADKISGVFVPAVLAIAAVTLAVWLLLGADAGTALGYAIAVLVISCPCALGLATPVAIMVGNGVGARHGILFKTAAALEHTGRTRIVALDKTGTITRGEPRVTDIVPTDGTAESLLAAAYALESKSEHPLAGAVCRHAREQGVTPEAVEDFVILPGSGLQATYRGKPLSGGNRAFMEQRGALPPSLTEAADHLAAEGKTPLFFRLDDRILGFIAVADTVKEDSPAAIRELRNMGIRVVMLTGDNRRTAAAIGRQAGVDDVIAGVLPEGKEEAIRRLQAQGATAMVGDGINDAPALTRADTGIAIGAGADVAIDAADVVLMHSRLSDVPAAIRLSRATLRNIRENLFWAFIYNVIGIPLAAGVFSGVLGWRLSPMFGAAAMSLSSVCVVTNALRLNLVKINKEEPTMEKTLKIEGMMCAHCEAHVKQALEALPGVVRAAVSHQTGTATLTLSAEVTAAALRQAVESAGYKVI